jgi:hypothetical protein
MDTTQKALMEVKKFAEAKEVAKSMWITGKQPLRPA